MSSNDRWIKLNVGGKKFLTTLKTIQYEPTSKLLDLVQDSTSPRDEEGAIMIDRDPELFKVLLEILRNCRIIFKKHITLGGRRSLDSNSSADLQEEAKYFGFNKCLFSLKLLEKQREQSSRVFRIMETSLEDVAKILSELSEGWHFEQLLKVSSYDPKQYLCIISKKLHEKDNSVEIPEKFLRRKK
ncbi:BTB/POZ domain-containing protein KCTD5 [Thelohanellus kitauei]|uniref:BTB/POZ domain-containing protein KCTD5 n=1 Tax=Thelohanellus kitauei TaxID=669202 RepID=A0A0C2N4U6_THEKT|nr:BTB/POZ domain-containing protein KCTD5 [Thelohanellus kitauei]